MNKITLNIVVVLLSILVSLLLVEFILVLKNSNMKNYDIEMWRYSKELKIKSKNLVLGHEHIPSKSAMLQNVDITLNKHGMRGANIEPLSYDRRILFLGSSITLGWGVDEDRTVTSLIQKEFNKNDNSVIVLNAGIGNYNAERYVELFLGKLKFIKPTDIVINYFINDAEELSSGRSNWLLKNSQLAATMWMAVSKLSFFGDESGLIEHYRNTYRKNSAGYKKMQLSLEKISKYAKENNINIYLTVIPDVHNLTDYPFQFIHNIMNDISKQFNFKFLDLYPAFFGISAKDIWAMPGDPHPNSLGHKIMADEIYPLLIK